MKKNIEKCWTLVLKISYMKISWLLDKFLYAYQLQQFKCSVYVIMNRRFFFCCKKKKESREYKSSNKRFQEKEYSDRSRSYAFVSLVSIKIADGPAECRISSWNLWMSPRDSHILNENRRAGFYESSTILAQDAGADEGGVRSFLSILVLFSRRRKR